jgi:hypothetical protein
VSIHNDAMCKAIEVSVTKVMIFDRVVSKLTSVRCILDHKKNLISFGTLDSLAYSYLVRDSYKNK